VGVLLILAPAPPAITALAATPAWQAIASGLIR
jgi:hypothetical protein